MTTRSPIFTSDTISENLTDRHTNVLPFGGQSQHRTIGCEPLHLGHERHALRRPRQVGNMAMLRHPSDQSLSGLALHAQTRDPDGVQRAPEPTADSQTRMESKMSSQTFIQTDVPRSSGTGPSLRTLVRPITGGLAAFARQFMVALHKSRQRQADQVIQRYRHLIDRSRD